MKISDFKNVWVVNLSRNNARYISFRSEVDKLGIEWSIKRFNAIDGERVKNPRWFGAGEYAWGCYRSHLSIIEQALNDNEDNVLIFEDDVDFNPIYKKYNDHHLSSKDPFISMNFKDRLITCLDELRDDWDFFYIGGQNLFQEEHPPVVISPHIIKCYNVNRTHAYAINKKALSLVYDHLLDYDNWQSHNHIDHHYGNLHMWGHVNTYMCYPCIVGQGEGKSDITLNKKPAYYWFVKAKERKATIAEWAKVKDYTVGFGDIGVGGRLGYEDKFVNPPIYNTITCSAHASSRVVVDLKESRYVYGYQEPEMDPASSIQVICDNFCLGELKKGNDYTQSFLLKQGAHVLEFKTENTGKAHSVWGFVEDPVCPLKNNDWVDIVISVLGPVGEEYKYDFTEKDADIVKSCLDKSRLDLHLSFIDECGEKEKTKQAMSYFDNYNRVDVIRISNPNNTWPISPTEKFGNSCLSNSTISLIGSNVYTCRYADSLCEQCKWDDPPTCSFEDYLRGFLFIPYRGSEEACRLCKNNKQVVLTQSKK